MATTMPNEQEQRITRAERGIQRTLAKRDELGLQVKGNLLAILEAKLPELPVYDNFLYGFFLTHGRESLHSGIVLETGGYQADFRWHPGVVLEKSGIYTIPYEYPELRTPSAGAYPDFNKKEEVKPYQYFDYLDPSLEKIDQWQVIYRKKSSDKLSQSMINRYFINRL